MVKASLTTTAVCALWFATGCDAEPEGPPYFAEVVAYDGFDHAAQAPRFALGVRELRSLEQLEHLRGTWFQLHRGGELLLREIDGELVSDGRFHGGDDADLRYFVDHGVIVARDYTTLGLLSAFHELEQVFTALEATTGVSAEALVGAEPFEVFFEPRIRVDGDVDGTQAMKINAFYVPGERQFGLARRSSLESVTLAGDRTVLAHEVGHALFDRVFFANAIAGCDGDGPPGDLAGRLRLEYVVRGLNEGFADFVSFAVTGSTNTLGGLEFTGDQRSLVGEPFAFRELVRRNVCDGRFYCIGTLLARSLYEAFVEAGGDPDDPAARAELMREVIRGLSQTVATLEARGSLPSPGEAVARCERATALDLTYDGRVAGAVLDAFATGLQPPWRSRICAALKRGFGEPGYPRSTRFACEELVP